MGTRPSSRRRATDGAPGVTSGAVLRPSMCFSGRLRRAWWTPSGSTGFRVRSRALAVVDALSGAVCRREMLKGGTRANVRRPLAPRPRSRQRTPRSWTPYAAEMTHLAGPGRGLLSETVVLEVLAGARLEPIVDLVAWVSAPGEYEVASAEGQSLSANRRRGDRRRAPAGPTRPGPSAAGPREPGSDASAAWRPSGRCRTPSRAATRIRTPSTISPSSSTIPRRPTSSSCTRAAHYWGDQGGHLGEHGSLGIVQARAPVHRRRGRHRSRLGLVDRSCRLRRRGSDDPRRCSGCPHGPCG